MFYFVLEGTCVWHAIEDSTVSTISPTLCPRTSGKFTSVAELVWQVALCLGGKNGIFCCWVGLMEFGLLMMC